MLTQTHHVNLPTCLFDACVMSCVSAPIAGILVTTLGARHVAISGAVLASIDFFLYTYSYNVYVIIVVYGLLGGKSHLCFHLFM